MTAPLRVLFVDDEQSVLDTMRRLLVVERVNWECSFSTSASHALRLLQAAHYDVVISDLRMPYMDGARLLAEIQHRWPHTLRVVCSGHMETSTMLSSVKSAHRYLIKPCKGSEIRAVVDDLLSIRFLLKKDNVRELVNRMNNIPVLPEVYNRVMEEIHKDEPSLQAIGRTIAEDVGMAASILRLVNSPFFGLRNEVRQPEQAVALLGLDTVRSSLLFDHLFTKLDIAHSPQFDISRLWTHCMETARIAQVIVQHEGLGQEVMEQCFAAGMLHDIGKLIFLVNFPDQYQEAVQTSRTKNIPIFDAEIIQFGVGHGEVGAYLLGLWGMPEYQIRSTACHHEPCQEKECGREALILGIVHAANCLDHELRVVNPQYARHAADESYLAKIGYENRYAEWHTICLERLKEGDQ
jgi:HD-like signal output (HDOD) protein